MDIVMGDFVVTMKLDPALTLALAACRHADRLVEQGVVPGHVMEIYSAALAVWGQFEGPQARQVTEELWVKIMALPARKEAA